MLHLVRPTHRSYRHWLIDLRADLQVGGATGEIGDPSGRSTERPVLAPDQLQGNTDAIAQQLRRVTGHAAAIWDRYGRPGCAPAGPPIQVVNNRDFYVGVSILDFLRQVGRSARVSTMLAKERHAQ